MFCEFAYILNLDTGKVECYKGFNEDPAAPGRYASLQRDLWDNEAKAGATKPDTKWYGCRLVAEFPMDAIPDDWEEQAYPQDADE